MADAYKLKADASFPRVVRTSTTNEGVEVQETEGRNYSAGGYVLAENMTPRDRERAEKGELDHLLEGVSLEEAQQGLAVSDRGLFIPEHEAESVALLQAGHEIVPRDQVLELRSAGADTAREVMEGVKSEGADERPNLSLAEFPSLAEVSNDTEGGTNNVPSESEPVDEERLKSAPSSASRGVEQPPGIPVGEDKASAEQDTEVVPRRRPGRPKKEETQQSGSTTTKKQQETAQAAKQQQENKG